MENRPAALDPVADDMVQQYMSAPIGFATPKTFLDVATEKSPAISRKVWAKVDVWAKMVKDSKGGPMYEANIYQMASALEVLPRVLEGAELEALAVKVKDREGPRTAEDTPKRRPASHIPNRKIRDS